MNAVKNKCVLFFFLPFLLLHRIGRRGLQSQYWHVTLKCSLQYSHQRQVRKKSSTVSVFQRDLMTHGSYFIFFFFFFIECCAPKSPGRGEWHGSSLNAMCVFVCAGGEKNSPPTFHAMKTHSAQIGVRRCWCWRWFVVVVMFGGVDPGAVAALHPVDVDRRVLVHKLRRRRGGGGDARSGLDWQIRGVCGRHVSKYCAIQFPTHITWGTALPPPPTPFFACVRVCVCPTFWKKIKIKLM